jgi:hypothetical protein
MYHDPTGLFFTKKQRENWREGVNMMKDSNNVFIRGLGHFSGGAADGPRAFARSVSLETEYGAGIGSSVKIKGLVEVDAKLAANEQISRSVARGVNRNWGTDFDIGVSVPGGFGLYTKNRVITQRSGLDWDGSTEWSITQRSAGVLIPIKFADEAGRADAKTNINNDIKAGVGFSTYFGFGWGVGIGINFSETRRQYKQLSGR